MGMMNWLHHYGYIGVFFVFLTEMIGAPFPAETTLTFCGIEWGRGIFHFFPLWFAASLGNSVGSAVSFAIGRFIGRPVLFKLGRYVRITEARFQKAQILFQRHRLSIVFFGKFVSGVRLLVPFMAGMEDMKFVWFSIYNLFSALLWAAVFLLEGRYLAWLFLKYNYVVVLIVIGLVILTGISRKMIGRRFAGARKHQVEMESTEEK